MKDYYGRPVYIPQLRILLKKIIEQEPRIRSVFSKENIPQWAVAFGTLALAIVTVFVLCENRRFTEIIKRDQMLKLRPEFQFELCDLNREDRAVKIINIGSVRALDVHVNDKIYLVTSDIIAIADDIINISYRLSSPSSSDSIWVSSEKALDFPGIIIESGEEKEIVWTNNFKLFKSIRTNLFENKEIQNIMQSSNYRCIIKLSIDFLREFDRRSYSQCEFFEYTRRLQIRPLAVLVNEIGGPSLIERILDYEKKGEEKRIGRYMLTGELEINPPNTYSTWKDRNGNEFTEDEKGRKYKKDANGKWILLGEKDF